MAIIEKNSPSVIFMGMSSFWTAFFKDSSTLEGLYNATSSLLGERYLNLMEVFLNASLKETPLFNKEDWKLLILSSNELTFDPTIYSYAETNAVNGKLTFTSRLEGSSYDNHFIQVSDLQTLNAVEKDLYVTSGIYNKFFITGIENHRSNWIFVVQNDAPVVDAVSLVNKRVITSKPISSYVVSSDIEITFFRENQEHTVTLLSSTTTGNTSLGQLVVNLQDAIDASTLTGVTVNSFGDYLIFEVTEGTLQLYDANEAAEEIYLIAFPFDITAFVPPGRESEFIWYQTNSLTLRTEGYSPAGSEYRFAIEDNLVDCKYIYNSLFNPTVALEPVRHFRIGKFLEKNYIYFLDNPFALTNVAFRDLGSIKEMALWMSDISYDRLNLFLNYGYQINVYEESSESYRNFLQGVFFYFTHGPQVKRVASALNIIAGIPVVSSDDEIVLSVQTTVSNHVIKTDQNTYTLPLACTPSVTVGDQLKAFDCVTDVFLVEDYINNPNWFDNIIIPEMLMPGTKYYHRWSVPHLHIPNIGDLGFVVGELSTDGAVVTTDRIRGQGVNSFRLIGDANFSIELDSTGVIHTVTITEAITADNNSLDDLIFDFKTALKQIKGIKVKGSGPNDFVLGSDASFVLTYLGTNYSISVTAAATADNLNMADLVSDLNDSLLDAGVTLVSVTSFDGLALSFVPVYDFDISLTNINLTAQIELGIPTSYSLTNCAITGDIDTYTISFASTRTIGSQALVSITDANVIAREQLGMDIFELGSGDLIGIDGDPSRGWKIMDSYLKYNLFRIKYNIGLVPSFRSIDDLNNLVLEGRPIYTFGIAIPEMHLEDSIPNVEATVDDVEDFINNNNSSMVVAEQTLPTYGNVMFLNSEGYLNEYIGGSNKTYQNFSPVPMFASLPNTSLIGGNLMFRAPISTGRIGYENHIIHVSNMAGLSPILSAKFPTPGIYNEGNTLGGVTTSYTIIGFSFYSGMFSREDILPFLNGEKLAAVNPHADFCLVVEHLISGGLVNYAIPEGHILQTLGFSNSANNDLFEILTISYNVSFLFNQMVDVIWFSSRGNALTPENATVGPFFVPATFRIKPGISNINKRWYFLVPDGLSIGASVNAAMSATINDEDIFPFSPVLNPANELNTWTQAGGPISLTTKATSGNPIYYGEKYSMNTLDPSNNATDYYASIVGFLRMDNQNTTEDTIGGGDFVEFGSPNLLIGGLGTPLSDDPLDPLNTFYIGGPLTFSVIGGNLIGIPPLDQFGGYTETELTILQIPL